MEERELLTFLIGVTVLLIALLQRRKLNLFPALRLPVFAFSLFVLSTLADVLDNVFAFQILSLFEHLLFVLGTAVLLYWVITLERNQSQ